jgi:transcriptional regulator with XRE-family HTH domain
MEFAAVDKPFSLILNDLLSRKNIKKVELARLLGVKSQTTISNWLNGLSTPDWNVLIRMKQVFKLNDIRELFGVETKNNICLTDNEYKEAILEARLEEARLIAMGKSADANNNKDGQGAGGRCKGGGDGKPSSTAPPE